ncbi:hypothetical protein FHY55_07995 [Oceanicola sp. D3]|uniref:hypothetical protein n=1 Tax=Oceanicola sp. D3 TaxID=2587163 RepID=UPI00111DFD85|nr:hypothetical protein [Oceanicola sp. D3]QDC09185.1 hypothetical protein FHY55_07995 [Oceanicola sp. D3]
MSQMVRRTLTGPRLCALAVMVATGLVFGGVALVVAAMAPGLASEICETRQMAAATSHCEVIPSAVLTLFAMWFALGALFAAVICGVGWAMASAGGDDRKRRA